MSQEFERPRFRTGENASKRYGGNISDAPFSQAIYKTAVSRGFETQSALARALEVSQGEVSEWYRGESIPSPKSLGKLLILFNANDEELEPVVETYAKRVGEQDASDRFKKSRRLMRPANNPVGGWIENFCYERKMPISEFTAILEITSDGAARRNYGRETLDLIRQNAKNKLKLSEKQTARLNKVIDEEIQQRTEKGHRFQSGLSGTKIVREQKKLNYSTYNGQQAGEMLGISREMVRQLRKKFSLPLLLTDKDIEMLKDHLERTRTSREKWQQARKRENQSLIILG